MTSNLTNELITGIVSIYRKIKDKISKTYNAWLNRNSSILNKPFDKMNLSDCYQYCEVMTRTKGTNFYLGFTMLPKNKRRAVFASYAFCRFVDDIVDEAEGEGRKKLDSLLSKWEIYLEDVYQGKGGKHPITRALADSVKRYPLPKHSFKRLIDGARLDIIKSRYETFEELLGYCDLVATTISEISLAIFGYRNTKAVLYGRYLAIALQLTNIIRDVGEDARRGRIYLPIEDLKRFGYSESELLRCEFNDKFINLMSFQIHRTREHYKKANPLLKIVEKDSKTGAYLMGAVYVHILNKIEKLGVPVFEKQVALSFWEKQTLLFGSLISSSAYVKENEKGPVV
ncbi:phytoene/squalene synthase family protein [Candidatus Micrarchaeota archaeon]|nr:phytoene/squalene synthase family protein [Candidatus Micrarchaeota archaeon]